MFDFGNINTNNLTRKQLMNQIKNSFVNKYKEDLTNNKIISSDVGKLFISLIPFDEKLPYLLLDGSVVSKFDYPELFKVYGYNFAKDAKENIPNENYFALPNLDDLAIIGQDELGLLDNTARIVGTNMPWRFPTDKLLNFDLSRIPNLAKNLTLADQSTNTNKPYSIKQQGKEYYIVKKSKNFSYKPNAYSKSSDIQIGNELRFNSIRVLFYTKYK